MASAASNSPYGTYSEVFSPERHAKSIQKHAFPKTGRGTAVKCINNSPWLQTGSRSPVVHHGEHPDVIRRVKSLTPVELARYSTPEGIIELNKKGIKLAIDRRIMLFFHQAISCRNMKAFTFSSTGAAGQIGTSAKITFSSTQGTSTTHKREAAHSSTNPGITATPVDGSMPSGFLYLGGGSSAAQHDATIGMENGVNGGDELIDGNGNDGKLRDVSAKILNQVRNGLDPRVATQKFIKAFDKAVVASAEPLEDDDTRKLALEFYHQRISKIKQLAVKPEFFDRLIGLSIDPKDPDVDSLREELFQKRYDIILLQEVVESRIGKQLADAQASMGRDKSMLEYILLKKFANTPFREASEKLFCKTAAIFEEEYGIRDDGTSCLSDQQKRNLKAFNTRVANLLSKHQPLIKRLKKLIIENAAELTSAEATYRSSLLWTIRSKVRGISKKEFCNRFLKVIGEQIPPSWVKKRERLAKKADSKVLISADEAEKCAKTLSVNSQVFFPELFSSE